MVVDDDDTTSVTASVGKKDSVVELPDDSDDDTDYSDDSDDDDSDDDDDDIVEDDPSQWKMGFVDEDVEDVAGGEEEDEDDGCVCNRWTGDNPKCRVHTYFPNASSLTRPPHSNVSSARAVSSSSRRLNRCDDHDIHDSPLRKKSKKGRVVDAMMSASTNTVSSLSTFSPTGGGTASQSSAEEDEVTHLLSGSKNKAVCWKFFKLYDLRFHPNKVSMAHCMLCGDSISRKGRGTTGMNKHLKAKHREEWEEANDPSESTRSGSSSSQLSVREFFETKEKVKTPEQLKEELICRVTNFVIERCMPFTIVESKSFRLLFDPFHKYAAKITTISANRVREAIFERGALAKKATMMEAAFFIGSWTCDHWTGKDGATYTTTTFHYIKNWVLYTIIVDFKVFSGTTSGEAIYKDQTSVLEAYTTKDNIVIGVTDTTASMGVLGQFLHQKGMQHAYCTDHNLQCNAILAFDGELLS